MKAAGNAAIALVDEGNALEEQGRIDEAMARYEAALQLDPRCARAHLNRGNVLLATGSVDEARRAYESSVACDSHYAAAHFNLGNLSYRLGQLDRALASYSEAVRIKPDFAEAHVAMANALEGLGRPREAADSYQRALVIRPDYAEAYLNLGTLQSAQGQQEQAVHSLRRAVEINPDFAEAHRSLGIELSKLEELAAAEGSHRRALALEPQSERIIYELVMILVARGNTDDALSLVMPALERAPTVALKAAFVTCVTQARGALKDARARTPMEGAIREPWGLPWQLAGPALDIVMLDERIARSVRHAAGSWPARATAEGLLDQACMAALADDSLLHSVLEAVPVNSIPFERLLTSARRRLLDDASDTGSPEASQGRMLRFHIALAQQCFINEYVFDRDADESVAADSCRCALLALLDANAVVPSTLLLAVAAYVPLYTLPGARRLLDATFSDRVEPVLRQQIREPIEEQALRAGIASLTRISSGVSESVRSQYEENPYPRWVRLPKPDGPSDFNAQLKRMLPAASFTPLPDQEAPQVLVAGCGTGSHSISTAQRFRSVRVLAIDLSLGSLGYAKRKTAELGITNIEYAQADILKLRDIGRTFDIIESVGVLHHLADPFAGWQTLLSLLRPSGFMLLGFYSAVARRALSHAREVIRERGYSSTPEDIRRFRRDLAAAVLPIDAEILSQSPDFYATSECRDLLFHVQEHCLTLRQIESFLTALSLRVIGFVLDRRVLHEYRVRFPHDPTATNLRHWEEFENDHPQTFAGMYVFWVQKLPEQ
jgi:tetratricopeptide (TPR) repeat protein/2-polyprenyl-3-methyl-5-hydroxy-6-metoxy-1,4-benzoquinol methylase